MERVQTYISSELTHFVGRSLASDEEQYMLLVKIINTGIIRTRNDNDKGLIMTACSYHTDFSSNDAFNPDMVCFCDIPVSDFEIHMKKYSHFGLSFSKEFMISQGMRPVYYIPQNTTVLKQSISDIFNVSFEKYTHLLDNKGILPLELEHFFNFQIFSFIKFFEDNKEDDDPDNYYMEREWRGLERIEFKIQDITRVILPSSFIKRFFQDIPDYNSHISTT
jgi:hypothetical protein